MVKVFNPVFTINVASKPKVRKENKESSNTISRKCYAVVKKVDNIYKAIVNIDEKYIPIVEGDEFSNSILTLDFTEDSLSLKDKTHVFMKERDAKGKIICVIRTTEQCHYSPGFDTQYDAVTDNLLIAGHIIRRNGKMYFKYEDLVKYNYLAEHKICDVKVDNSKPLFNK